MNLSNGFDNAIEHDVDNKSNLSEFSEYILWRYNEKLFDANKLVVGYIVILAIVGVLGNATVIYIYGFRFKMNTMNLFTLWLGIFDTLTASMLSFEALDRRYPVYSGTVPILCKTVRLLESLCVTSSVGILICIAFDRYYRICHPMKAFTLRKAKQLLTLSICVTGAITWPMVLFQGPETVPTGIPDVVGMDCADDDKFKNTMVIFVFYVCIAIINVICFVVLIVMYILIYKAIWKWKHTTVGEQICDKTSKSARSVHVVRQQSSCNRKRRQISESNVVVENSSENVMEQARSSVLIGTNLKSNTRQQHSGKPEDQRNIYVIDTLDTTGMTDTDLHSRSIDPCKMTSDCRDVEPEYSNILESCRRNGNRSSDIDDHHKYYDNQETQGHFCYINSKYSSYSNATVFSGKPSDVVQTFDHHATTNENCTQFNMDSTSHRSEMRFAKSLNDSRTLHGRRDSRRSERRGHNGKSYFSENGNKLPSNSVKSLKRRTGKSSARIARSIILFSVITAAFILSYVPYLIIEALHAAGMLDINHERSLVTKQILRLANSSLFISTAINPVIYGNLNPEFKKELRIIFLGEQVHMKHRYARK